MTKELLKRLVEAHAPSGFEEEVRDILAKELHDYVDEMEIDGYGNLISVKHGSGDGLKVMFLAHMDEVGLMVKHIDDEGFLYFELNGWIDPRVLLSEEVIIHTVKGRVKGIIGTKGAHLVSPEQMKLAVPLDNLWIDVGAASRDQAAGLGIRPGDPVTFDRKFRELAGGRAQAKSMDDRMGIAALIGLMKSIEKEGVDATVYGVGTVQEEVGARGAIASAYTIKPDIAIVMDTNFSTDPITPLKETGVEIGKGPTIRMMEMAWKAAVGNLTPRFISDTMINAAEEEGIPYQIDAVTFFSDAILTTTRGGIPTGNLMLARRYYHSPAEVCQISDIDETAKLAYATARRLTPDILPQKKLK